MVALLSSLVSASALLHRATQQCSGSTYNATEGLIFTKYCGQILSCQGSSWCEPKQNYNTFEDCMNACASTNRKCYGVSYFVSTKVCTLQYTSNTIVVNSTTADTAIADVSHLSASGGTSCPAKDDSTLTNGKATFKVHCSKSAGDNGDYCPTNMPCRRHADSFTQCLNYCGMAKPLCTAVVWNADEAGGFINCRFKNASSYYNGFATVTSATHSGELTNKATEEGALQGVSKTSYSSSGKDFDILSNATRSGSTTIASSHETSIESCIDACASSQSCNGLSYATQLNDGWYNCQLFNDTGNAGSSSSTMAVALVKSSDGNSGTSPTSVSSTDSSTTSSSSGANDSQRRKIGLGVGLGIGIPVLLIAAITLYCCLRASRRRNDPRESRQRPQYQWHARYNGVATNDVSAADRAAPITGNAASMRQNDSVDNRPLLDRPRSTSRQFHTPLTDLPPPPPMIDRGLRITNPSPSTHTSVASPTVASAPGVAEPSSPVTSIRSPGATHTHTHTSDEPSGGSPQNDRPTSYAPPIPESRMFVESDVISDVSQADSDPRDSRYAYTSRPMRATGRNPY